MIRKGIILAGGSGTRLYPLTKVVSKQLLPIYNKPTVFYPLYTLLKAEIRDILIISTVDAIPQIERLLGDGHEYGAKFSYKVQDKPNGIAEAFILGAEHINNDPVCLILGDNIFYGSEFEQRVKEACADAEHATVFGYRVSDPERYGVAEFDADMNVLSLEEKPAKPKSSYAVVGLYFYPASVVEVAKNLQPSARGELEITDVNKIYLKTGNLKFKKIGFGNAWLDSGTFDSLNDASNFVRTIEERTGIKVSDIEQFKQRKDVQS